MVTQSTGPWAELPKHASYSSIGGWAVESQQAKEKLGGNGTRF